MARILGLVNLHTSPNLSPLTDNRVVGTLSFLGRYACIDFPLSNFSNSNINTVGILVNKAPRSVIKHMANAMNYTNNTKLGKTVICYNEKYANNPLYNTDINNLIENKWLIEEKNYNYIVIAPSHILYTMDFNNAIEEHIKNNASITCLYKKANSKDNLNRTILSLNENNELKEIKQNLGASEEINLSLRTYIINKDKLLKIIELGQKISNFFDLEHIIDYLAKEEVINTYEFDGYTVIIDSIQNYLMSNLNILNMASFNTLIKRDWPIYTSTFDTPPARYLKKANVTKAIISNGAIIDGTVDNSIICRDAKIGENASITNSIISSNAQIAENAILDYVIVDKNAKILHVKELRGTKENPLYVGQGDII